MRDWKGWAIIALGILAAEGAYLSTYGGTSTDDFRWELPAFVLIFIVGMILVWYAKKTGKLFFRPGW